MASAQLPYPRSRRLIVSYGGYILILVCSYSLGLMKPPQARRSPRAACRSGYKAPAKHCLGVPSFRVLSTFGAPREVDLLLHQELATLATGAPSIPWLAYESVYKIGLASRKSTCRSGTTIYVRFREDKSYNWAKPSVKRPSRASGQSIRMPARDCQSSKRNCSALSIPRYLYYAIGIQYIHYTCIYCN